MNILVTGPDGVLGSNLVRELLSRNYKVSTLLLEGTSSKTLDGLSIERHYGNILNPQDLDNAIKGKDIVIHCAASTSVYPAKDPVVNKVNIDGTMNVVDACLNHDVKRLIYVGTANSFGFGTSHDDPGHEEKPYSSAKYGLDYMDSKRIAQEKVLDAVKNRNLNAVIVNPTFMIGPYDSRPSSGAMILALHNGKVPGYTSGGKNYVAVKDVAIAISNAITMGRIGECYILGNRNMTYGEAFQLIAETINVKVPKLKLSDFTVKTFGSFNSTMGKLFGTKPTVTKEIAIISCEKHFFTPEKARKELLLPSTPIEVAVEECYAWFKENGYLNK